MATTTDQQFSAAKPPLGVGKIIGDSFSILFGKIVTVIAVSAGPIAFGLIISGLLIGWGTTFGTEVADPTAFTESAFVSSFVLTMVLQMVIYGFTTALLVLVAYDAKLGRSRSIGAYFAPALRAALPVAVLMIAVSLLTGLGAVALVIGALWVYAVFSVTTPAIVIEGVGYRGMGRSAALTKEYRWPIAGALVVVMLLTMVLSIAVQAIAGLVAGAVGSTSAVGIVVSLVIFSAMQALTFGLSSIASALIFARLKEIKEGVGVDRLAAVFE